MTTVTTTTTTTTTAISVNDIPPGPTTMIVITHVTRQDDDDDHYHDKDHKPNAVNVGEIFSSKKGIRGLFFLNCELFLQKMCTFLKLFVVKRFKLFKSLNAFKKKFIYVMFIG